MPNYCIVTLVADGCSPNSRHFVCGSDKDAVVWAEQQIDQQSIELWAEDRLVRRIDPVKPDGTVTRKIREGKLVPEKVEK